MQLCVNKNIVSDRSKADAALNAMKKQIIIVSVDGGPQVCNEKHLEAWRCCSYVSIPGR